MNLFSYEDLLYTQNTHKFDSNFVDNHNKKQYELCTYLFSNFLNFIFEKENVINEKNINSIVKRFNDAVLIDSNKNNNDVDLFSKKCCIYYLFNIYRNSNNVYNLKKIYYDLKHNNIETLFVNIWSEMSIIDLFQNIDENEKFIINESGSEIENSNILYEYMITLYMFNIHNIVPNFINTIGLVNNPLKFNIPGLKDNNYNIIDNSNDEHIILYDSDFDCNLIEHLSQSSNQFDTFINVFFQLYRALAIANHVIHFNHCNTVLKNIYIKKLNTPILIHEIDDIIKIAKTFGYEYQYQQVENVSIITNYSKSSLTLIKNQHEIKLKKINENIGGMYTFSQDILTFLIDSFVFVKSQKNINQDLYNLLHYVLSKMIKSPEDIDKFKNNDIPLNIYNRSNKLVFSFKNKNNAEIIANVFEYLKNIDYSMHGFVLSHKKLQVYPNETNINNNFKYSSVSLFNNILNNDINFDFIVRIHSKEYENYKEKIVENIKILKTYEYLKITFETSGINDDIFEELAVLIETVLKYIYNIKMFIYYAHTTIKTISNVDLNKVIIPDATLQTLNLLFHSINNEACTNSKLLKFFKINNYEDKNNVISFINNYIDYS